MKKKMLRKKIGSKKNLLTNKNDISCSFQKTVFTTGTNIRRQKPLLVVFSLDSYTGHHHHCFLQASRGSFDSLLSGLLK